VKKVPQKKGLKGPFHSLYLQGKLSSLDGVYKELPPRKTGYSFKEHRKGYSIHGYIPKNTVRKLMESL